MPFAIDDLPATDDGSSEPESYHLDEAIV